MSRYSILVQKYSMREDYSWSENGAKEVNVSAPSYKKALEKLRRDGFNDAFGVEYEFTNMGVLNGYQEHI